MYVREPRASILMLAPHEVPGAACFEKLGSSAQARNLVEWELWVDTFLAETLRVHDERCGHPVGATGRVRHRLRRLAEPEVEALGADRDPLAIQILHVWNWVPRQRDNALPFMPSPAMQEITARICKRLHGVDPATVLAWRLPRFVLAYRVLVAPKRGAGGAPEDEGYVPPEMIEHAEEALGG